MSCAIAEPGGQVEYVSERRARRYKRLNQGNDFMNTVELSIDGMTCNSCVTRVRRALESIEGVATVAVDLLAGRARVEGTLDPSAGALINALTDAGYPAQLAGAPASPAATTQSKGARGGCCCS